VPHLRLLRTTAFRLALTFLSLFSVSTLAVGSIVYVAIRDQILTEFDERITEEADSLAALARREGPEALAAAIRARGEGGALAYGLRSRDGRAIAGEVEPLVAKGWFETREEATPAERGESETETVRALAVPLDDGSTLVVGDELRRPEAAIHTIASAFAWSLVLTFLIGGVGGLWVSRRLLRRVDEIRSAADAIAAGDWRRRISLPAANDEIAALAGVFNRLFERIERLILANKQSSAMIAHDLRKPLAKVLRRLEAIPDRSERVDEAIADIERVLETFEALLRIGEIEAGARRAAFRAVDMAEIVQQVAEAYLPVIEEERRSLRIAFETSLAMTGDRDLLVQMIANLFDNALRHTPKGVGIEITGKATGADLRLQFADTGPGVPQDDRARIFERFHRGPAAVNLPGSGLGLSLVAAIADLHGLLCEASDNAPGLRISIASRHGRLVDA